MEMGTVTWEREWKIHPWRKQYD